MSSRSIGFRPTIVIKQLPWSIDKKATLGFLLILTTFSLIGWLYLGQASSITSTTMKIDRLNQKISLLNQKNSELALEIAELESINRVEERARALGFTPTHPANIRYLTIDNFPAITSPDVAFESYPSRPQPSLWQVWLDQTTAWVVGNSE